MTEMNFIADGQKIREKITGIELTKSTVVVPHKYLSIINFLKELNLDLKEYKLVYDGDAIIYFQTQKDATIRFDVSDRAGYHDRYNPVACSLQNGKFVVQLAFIHLDSISSLRKEVIANYITFYVTRKEEPLNKLVESLNKSEKSFGKFCSMSKYNITEAEFRGIGWLELTRSRVHKNIVNEYEKYFENITQQKDVTRALTTAKLDLITIRCALSAAEGNLKLAQNKVKENELELNRLQNKNNKYKNITSHKKQFTSCLSAITNGVILRTTKVNLKQEPIVNTDTTAGKELLDQEIIELIKALKTNNEQITQEALILEKDTFFKMNKNLTIDQMTNYVQYYTLDQSTKQIVDRELSTL